jgi:group I intron endonuclease
MEKQKRAEIKRNYKQTHRPMGVYQIKNLTNDKILVGSSLNLDSIKNRHFFELKMGSHRNETLQKEWNEYGETAFSFTILEQIKPEEETVESFDILDKYRAQLQALEEQWIDKLQPYGERGYN